MILANVTLVFIPAFFITIDKITGDELLTEVHRHNVISFIDSLV
jgi:hypothetical protein